MILAPDSWKEILWGFWQYIVLIQALLSFVAMITSLVLMIAKKYPSMLTGVCMTALSVAFLVTWSTWTVDWFTT